MRALQVRVVKDRDERIVNTSVKYTFEDKVAVVGEAIRASIKTLAFAACAYVTVDTIRKVVVIRSSRSN